MAALLILSFGLPVLGAPERPRTGIGLLLLRPLRAERAGDLTKLVLYATPGIRRVAVMDVARLPSLSPFIAPPGDGYALAVTALQGDWLRIAYDDADRPGWLRRERYWDFFLWKDYLPGRTARLAPGILSRQRMLRESPADDAPLVSGGTEVQRVRILQVEGDWIRASGEGSPSGWLRWRDGYGRILLVIDATAP